MKRYRRKSRRIIKFVILQILIISIILVCSKNALDLYRNQIKNNDYDVSFATPEVKTASGQTKEKDSALFINPKKDKIASHNAILIRLSDKKILFRKRSKEVIYPASMTKIMTALVAMEHLKDLKQPIELPSDMFQKLYDEDASMAGFLPEETVPAIDLLYGVLLPSGAECCIGLCDYIAGSEDDFVSMMNEKAKALGMKHTHFTNSTGLNDKNHYTTVSDLAKLLEYALKNDTFRKIFTSSKHTTASASLHPDGITFYSTMFANMSSPDFEGGRILGGKTGYTSDAGLCLASLAKINGTEYILVTAGAKGNHDTEQYNIRDAFHIYEDLN